MKYCLSLLIAILFFNSTTFAQNDLLQSGPMLGYSEKTEVLVWVQTTKPAKVEIKYWDRQKAKTEKIDKIAKTTTAIQTTAEGDHIARFAIGQLDHGTAYDYEVLINGKPIKHSVPYTFKTQLLWEWRTDPPDFTAAIGSCAYVNEDSVDRPGIPYGSDYHIFQMIADKKPDLMLWLGDNTYLREVDWSSWSGILHRWRHTRSLKELQPLLPSVHHYAIWDDHDYGPNDSDRGYMFKFKTLEAFKMYFGNPAYGFSDVPGVFFKFTWNDVDFFMLDDRFYRSPRYEEDTPNKTMIGKAQMQWLKDALTTSMAPFKIIACGSQVLNEYGDNESYNLYKFERKELIDFIRKNEIAGVLFISGDRHFTEMNRKDIDSNFYPLYDYTSSSLTAGLHRSGKDIKNPLRVPGSVFSDQHNFGLLKFSGKRKDRKLTIETYDDKGNLLWNFSIHENDLKPKSKQSDTRH